MALSRIETDGLKDSAVTAAKIADGTVVAAEIGADAVDGTKIADNAINSEHYTDGSIDLAHLSADSVDGTKIVDDAINSEHYAAASVDDAHLATGISASKLTGALPAISGASLTNLPAGGDTRNFILDGNFSQWPEGITIAQANNTYGHLFWKAAVQNSGAGFSAVKSTDIPTVAQSKYQSRYSMQMDCTTADTSIGSAELFSVHTHVTGEDYQHLHGQEVTLAFWVKATITGISCVYFQNNDLNRSYVSEFTINASNTWEYKTITLTLDSSGTWLFNKNIGLTVGFTMNAGTSYHGTNNTWEAARDHATSNQVNHASSTSNNFNISQIGLYLGSSAPDRFLSDPAAILHQKRGYYFRYSATSLGVMGHLRADTGGAVHWVNAYNDSKISNCSLFTFEQPMRDLPLVYTSDMGGTNDRIATFQGSLWGYNNGRQGYANRISPNGIGRLYTNTDCRGLLFHYKLDARH